MADGDSGGLVAGGGATLMPVDEIMKAYNASNQNYMESLGDLTKLLQQGQGAAQQDQAAIAAQAKVDQAKNVLETDARVKLQRDNAAASAALGTNQDASSYVLTAMADSVLNADKKIDADRTAHNAQLDDIKKRGSVGLFDDPLQYIVNQFTLPQDIFAYNIDDAKLANEIGGRNDKLTVMRELLSRTSEVAVKNQILDQVDATKAGLLQDQTIANAAQRNLAESKTKALQLNLQGLQLKDAITGKMFSSLMEFNSAVVQRETLSLEKSRLNLAEVNASYTNELKDQLIRAKSDDAEAKAALKLKLDRITAVTGKTAVGVNEYLHMTGRERETYDAMMSDPNIQDPTSVYGRLANQPAKALEYSININMPLTPGANMVRDKLNSIRSSLIAGSQNWKSLSPDVQQVSINDEIIKRVKTELTDIKPQGGLYSPPSLKAVIAGNPSIANFEISRELAPIIVANGDQPADPNLLIKTAMKLVKAGKIDTDQAATEISTMYRGVMTLNNQIHQYSKFALPMMARETTGFNQTVYLGHGWGSSFTVDLSNPARVKDALLRSAISAKRGMITLDTPD